MMERLNEFSNSSEPNENKTKRIRNTCTRLVAENTDTDKYLYLKGAIQLWKDVVNRYMGLIWTAVGKVYYTFKNIQHCNFKVKNIKVDTLPVTVQYK